MLLDVAEQVRGVDAVEVDFGEVGNHHFAERDELLEGLEAPFDAFQRAMDVEKLEKQKFVRCNLLVAKLRHQLVDAYDRGQEEGPVAHRLQLLAEKKTGAAVVENHGHVFYIVLMLSPDALCHRVKKRFH